MTIFLMVLKKLIKEQLGPLATTLNNQITAFGYNPKLSLEQKEKVEQLDASIIAFTGANDDETDYQDLIKIIDAVRREIGTIRERHGEAAAKGNTVKSLTDLSDHIKSFYFKLADFEFKLLDRAYASTPEHITYFHACYYFGEEIFSPSMKLDVNIRNKKEETLVKRLQQLSQLIKPESDLEEQRKWTLQTLKDLATDNRDIVKKPGSFNLPGLSFWGIAVTAPNDIFSASEGRFAVQFSLAINKVEAMTAATFEPSDAYEPELEHAHQ